MALTIPQIRTQLHGIAETIRRGEVIFGATAARIDELAEATRRRPAKRRAPSKHRPLTDQEKAEIKVYAEVHRLDDYKTIANLFNTTTGRVSEAVSGYRWEDAA